MRSGSFCSRRWSGPTQRTSPYVNHYGTCCDHPVADLHPGAWRRSSAARKVRNHRGRLKSWRSLQVSVRLLACAVAGFGVWALIWQQIVFYAVRLTLTLTRSPYRPRLIFDLRDAWEHVIFGRNLLGVTLITSASRSLENLAIGKDVWPWPCRHLFDGLPVARLPFMLVTGPLQYVLVSPCRGNSGGQNETRGAVPIAHAGLSDGGLACGRPGGRGKRADFSSAVVEEMGPSGPHLRPHRAGGGIATCDGNRRHVLDGTRSNRCANAPRGAVRGSVAYRAHAVGVVRHRSSRGHVFHLHLLFSVWSLRVCLPLVDCSFTAYFRALLLPMTLTISSILVYQVVGSIAPDHEVMNACLAAVLAFITSAIALVCQRRDLLAGLSLPLHYQVDLLAKSHIPD